MKMMTLIATATAIMSRVAMTGATALRWLGILNSSPAYGAVNCDCAKVPTFVVTLMFMTSPERMLVVTTVVGLARVIVTAPPLAMMVDSVALAFAVQVVASLAVTPVELADVVTPERVGTRTLPENPALDEIPETWRLPRVTPTAPTFLTMMTTWQPPVGHVVAVLPST